jgi:diamine N-acetyltransferase
MAASVLIRPVGHGDLAALGELARSSYSAAFGPTMSASDLAAHLRDNLADACFRRALEEDVILVAERSGRLAGFVQFGPIRIAVADASPGDQELRRLYVMPGLQRRGIGRKLMEDALAHPRLRRAGRIYLDVWERNFGARRLYEALGFKVIGAQPFAVASGVGQDLDLVMVRADAAAVD